MNCDSLLDPRTFHLEPSSGQNFYFSEPAELMTLPSAAPAVCASGYQVNIYMSTHYTKMVNILPVKG